MRSVKSAPSCRCRRISIPNRQPQRTFSGFPLCEHIARLVYRPLRQVQPGMTFQIRLPTSYHPQPQRTNEIEWHTFTNQSANGSTGPGTCSIMSFLYLCTLHDVFAICLYFYLGMWLHLLSRVVISVFPLARLCRTNPSKCLRVQSPGCDLHSRPPRSESTWKCDVCEMFAAHLDNCAHVTRIPRSVFVFIDVSMRHHPLSQLRRSFGCIWMCIWYLLVYIDTQGQVQYIRHVTINHKSNSSLWQWYRDIVTGHV